FKEALSPEFNAYQQQVLDNSRALVDGLLGRGLDVVSGGTDNHLCLIDLSSKGLTGKDVESALHSANITTNKNAVPNDPQSPFVTSGVRVGTPAITTRGFGLSEMTLLANWISDIVDNMGDESVVARVKQEVLDTCARFPVYSS
ncbi:MAG TPA: serine hydroxymethyltransferase, partial [Gammaproteobacteria bacterium]|nr:serine hydroxymethyltransferase [Gammaproteobacteria bacterium]